MKKYKLIYRDGIVTKEHVLKFKTESQAIQFFDKHLSGDDVVFVEIIETYESCRKGHTYKGVYGSRFADWIALGVALAFFGLGLMVFVVDVI